VSVRRAGAVGRRGSGQEDSSIINVLESYQSRLKNTYMSARRALEEHIRYGAPIDNFYNAIDDMEATFDRLVLALTIPSSGPAARQMDVVIKQQESVYQNLTELRNLVGDRMFSEAVRKLDEVYESMRMAVRITLLVYAGWKATMMRAVFPGAVEYIPAEEIPVTDPLARRIYDVLVEEGMMRAEEIRDRFREYPVDRINRAIEELEARGLVRIRLRGGDVYLAAVT